MVGFERAVLNDFVLKEGNVSVAWLTSICQGCDFICELNEMATPIYVISKLLAWRVPFIVRLWFVNILLENEFPSNFCTIQVSVDICVVDSHCIVMYEIVDGDLFGPKARIIFAVPTFWVDIFIIFNCKDVVVLTCWD